VNKQVSLYYFLRPKLSKSFVHFTLIKKSVLFKYSFLSIDAVTMIINANWNILNWHWWK